MPKKRKLGTCIHACCGTYAIFPFTLTSPSTFVISPRMAERSEDFPLPTVPTTATSAPSSTLQVRSFSVQAEAATPAPLSSSLSSHMKLQWLRLTGKGEFSPWLI